MREEKLERCDLCGEIGQCIYLRDWGVWVCIGCYWNRFNVKRMKNQEIS